MIQLKNESNVRSTRRRQQPESRDAENWLWFHVTRGWWAFFCATRRWAGQRAAAWGQQGSQSAGRNNREKNNSGESCDWRQWQQGENNPLITTVQRWLLKWHMTADAPIHFFFFFFLQNQYRTITCFSSTHRYQANNKAIAHDRITWFFFPHMFCYLNNSMFLENTFRCSTNTHWTKSSCTYKYNWYQCCADFISTNSTSRVLNPSTGTHIGTNTWNWYRYTGTCIPK